PDAQAEVATEVGLAVAGQPDGLEVAGAPDDPPGLQAGGQAERAGGVSGGCDVGVDTVGLHVEVLVAVRAQLGRGPAGQGVGGQVDHGQVGALGTADLRERAAQDQPAAGECQSEHVAVGLEGEARVAGTRGGVHRPDPARGDPAELGDLAGDVEVVAADDQV